MSANTQETADVEEDSCHFCGETEVLQEHHIVPQRFDGSDESVNLVTLCPTCHRKIESMYDKRFYDELGVEKPESAESEITGACHYTGCTATADHELTCPEDGGTLRYCDPHKDCAMKSCDKRSVTPVRMNGGHTPLCDEHRVCREDGCENREVKVYRSNEADHPGEFKSQRVLCDIHAKITEPWMGDEWLEVWSDE